MSELLRDTQLAFDSVAANYDGALGNNALVQRIRTRTMAAVRQNLSPGSRLLDLGCGTGLDAEYLAGSGYFVTVMDWSGEMVHRTKNRIVQSNLQARVEVKQLGFHQLAELQPDFFDGVYSDLGALNCAEKMDELAESLARILKPQGKLIASVIGRICPWEWSLYASKGQWQRAGLRSQREMVPVPLNGRTVWTRYFSPREFELVFARAGFELVSLRALSLFVPPPYMIGFAGRHPAVVDFLQSMDDSIGSWPLFRNWGDHFLIVLQKNG